MRAITFTSVVTARGVPRPALVALVALAIATAWPPGVDSAEDPAEAGERSITAADLRDVVTFLSSDRLEGRLTGSSGNRRAVKYLTDALDAAGLRPAAPGFLQPFTPAGQRLRGRPRLEARIGAAKMRRFRAGRDFDPVFPTSSGHVTGTLAFAGYGVDAPDAGHDDFGALDLSGRPVLVVQAAPRGSNERAAAWHDPLSLASRVAACATRGATAVVVASTDDISRLEPISLWARRSESPPRRLALLDDMPAIPVIRVTAETAVRLLGETDVTRPGIKLRDLADLVPAARRQPDTSVTIEVRVEPLPVQADNVVAWVPGRDPEAAHEMVVVSAHLDHEGRDSLGRVMNGADDDASGTAAVLETARAFAMLEASGTRPRRSVAFAFFNGEERGLLGSRYFVRHVQPQGHAVIACVNLDMVGRREHIPKGVDDPRYGGLPPVPSSSSASTVHGIGYSYSHDLAALARGAADAEGLDLRLDYDAHPVDLLHRSDHWSFLQLGIPSLFLTTGLHPDYHTPDDDGNRIELGKLERVARMAYRLARAVADANAPPLLSSPSRN